MKVKLLSHVWLFATPWTAAYQAPLPMEFSRQEYWSGLPLPSLMTNLDSILKSRDITLSTKACLVKAMVFPVVMHGCESWTVKKAEHRRTDAFELWCWRRFLRVPWTARRSILKEMVDTWVFIGRADVKAETPILWPPDEKSWLIWKDLDAGKDWEQEEKGMTGWDGWMASPILWTWVCVDSGSWW